MVVVVHISGYDKFVEYFRNLNSKGKIVNVLFTGSKVNGVSWCSDCVEAHPIISDALKLAPEDSYFVTVDVGDRPTWKAFDCKFRLDKDTHLMVIPTLIRWKCPQRLEGDYCKNAELLEMFFTDEIGECCNK